MAVPGSEEISVIVVDGVLKALHGLGFPLSALVRLESKSLMPLGTSGRQRLVYVVVVRQVRLRED